MLTRLSLLAAALMVGGAAWGLGKTSTVWQMSTERGEFFSVRSGDSTVFRISTTADGETSYYRFFLTNAETAALGKALLHEAGGTVPDRKNRFADAAKRAADLMDEEYGLALDDRTGYGKSKEKIDAIEMHPCLCKPPSSVGLTCLCPSHKLEDRSKGHIRPVRMSYKHVGIPGPEHHVRDLTDDERKTFGDDYFKFEEYPQDKEINNSSGRFWTKAELDKVGKGCSQITTMPKACAETYAKNPRYYGETFCGGCGKYLRVGEHGEFVWLDDGSRVGT